MLLHARNFSELMLGAALLYNLILAEQAQRDDGVEDYRVRFTEWVKMLAPRSRAFADWRRERFWELANASKQRITPAAHDFITAWCELALGGNAGRLREN